MGWGMNSSGRAWVAVLAGGLVFLMGHRATASVPDARGVAPGAFPSFSAGVHASGFRAPGGLALHPDTGDLFVAEEDAGRIAVVRAGKTVYTIGPDLQLRDTLPDWLVTDDRPRTHWLNPRLANPEGLAFGPDGALYVVEDTPGGRVLVFEPEADGVYRRGAVVPVPNMGDAYAWEAVAVSREGRLFLVGSSHERGLGVGFSCVLSRDADQTWWLVDYSPLAAFSALALSRAEDIVVVGDESVGGLTWWDIARHREVQTVTEDLSRIEGLAILPDGSLVIAQESVPAADGRPAGGRLVRVDPAGGPRTVIAEGLGTIESVVCDERTGRLYVTEDSTGRVLSFSPGAPFGPHQELLQLTRRSGEARRGVPPRQTPDFLRSLMKKVGVELMDDGREGGGRDGTVARGDQIPPMTLEELGRRIPLVAGRVSVEPIADDPDPIVEVSFINFFPNQLVSADNRPMPGFCLFAARHRSGKIDRSQILGGLQARRLGPDGKTAMLHPEAMMMVPLTTCSAVESDNGVTVTMAFIGLDRFKDCYLTLNYGRRNEAWFTVSGEQLRVARASFSEKQADGREVINFAMTGVRPRRAEDATWLRLSTEPRWTLLLPSTDPWVSRWSLANVPDLVAQMRRFNENIAAELLAADERAAQEELARGKDESGETEESAAVDKAEPGHAEAPKPVFDPLVNIEIAPTPVSEEDLILTNLILSRIVMGWPSGVMP